MRSKIVILFSLMCLSIITFSTTVVANTTELSPGIQHQKYNQGNKNFNTISIDLNSLSAKVGLGISQPNGSKMSTTKLATSRSSYGYRIVGAMNASFFNMSTGENSYLVAKNNEIFQGSFVSTLKNEYVSEPIAFGILKNGKGEIDHFETKYSVTVDGKNIAIDGVNRKRLIDDLVIYTPQYFNRSTDAGKYGEEYIIELERPLAKTMFGQKVKGKVKNIEGYMQGGNAVIPKNGLVISAHGKRRQELQLLQVGKELTIDFGIEDKWMDAAFILGSGPLLVKDGKPYLTIDTNSWRAKQITARSAVAISKDKSKVHLITVDATRTGGGMNLIDFANHLAQLGYDRAINMDGGGSTTMAVRPYTMNQLVLANRPMDGSERAVTTIIEAVNTSKYTNQYQVEFEVSNQGKKVMQHSSVAFTPKVLMDSNYHIRDKASLELRAAETEAQINGHTITPLKSGKIKIDIYYYNTYVDSFTIDVINEVPNMKVVIPTKNPSIGETVQISVQILDERGKEVHYHPSQLKWSLSTSELGTITQQGKWTVGAKGGITGQIITELGSTKKMLDVEVKKSNNLGLIDISSSYHYFDVVEYMLKNDYMQGFPINNSSVREFRPDNYLSRKHAVHILSKIEKWDLSTSKPHEFVDIPKNDPYEREISKAFELGIMTGEIGKDGKRRFLPDQPVSRAHVAKIFVENYQLKGTSPLQFKDVSKDSWYYPYIDNFVGSGVSTGYVDEGLYRPDQSISRVHFSKLFYEYNKMKK